MPSNRLRYGRPGLRTLGILAALFCAGCAKFPDAVVGPGSQRIVFRVTVEREINPAFVYIVALRPTVEENPTDSGPIPVIAPPWGNGFVAGNCTHFVRWDPTQSPRFLVYRFRDASLLDYFPTGVPIRVTEVVPGDRQIEFELDLTQISDAPETLRNLQVNFLTMDRVPQGSTGSKNWDALGDGRLPSGLNQWVTIPLRTSGRYDNARLGGIEPDRDAPDPDLEIVDFSVEVFLQ